MKKCASLFAPHLGVGIAKHKPDGCKEITLPGAITSYDDVMLRREGLNDGLILVAVVTIRRVWLVKRKPNTF